MTVIGYTVARPHHGKRPMAENRARQLGEIYAKHGAQVKIANVVSGPNTGCIVLLRGYADFRTAAKAFQAINNDPAHAEFWREREANPAADIVTPNHFELEVLASRALPTMDHVLAAADDLHNKATNLLAVTSIPANWVAVWAAFWVRLDR